VLNIISIAIAMQRIFALTKKKIFQNIYQQFRNSIGISFVFLNYLFLKKIHPNNSVFINIVFIVLYILSVNGK